MNIYIESLPVAPTSSSRSDTPYADTTWVSVPIVMLKQGTRNNMNVVHFALPFTTITEKPAINASIVKLPLPCPILNEQNVMKLCMVQVPHPVKSILSTSDT